MLSGRFVADNGYIIKEYLNILLFSHGKVGNKLTFQYEKQNCSKPNPKKTEGKK